eukprot:g34325.t1
MADFNFEELLFLLNQTNQSLENFLKYIVPDGAEVRSDEFKVTRILISIVYFIVCVLGLVGNLLVLCLLQYEYGKKKSTMTVLVMACVVTLPHAIYSTTVAVGDEELCIVKFPDLHNDPQFWLGLYQLSKVLIGFILPLIIISVCHILLLRFAYIFPISICLAHSNSCLNPILYCLMRREFQAALRELLLKMTPIRQIRPLKSNLASRKKRQMPVIISMS